MRSEHKKLQRELAEWSARLARPEYEAFHGTIRQTITMILDEMRELAAPEPVMPKPRVKAAWDYWKKSQPTDVIKSIEAGIALLPASDQHAAHQAISSWQLASDQYAITQGDTAAATASGAGAPQPEPADEPQTSTAPASAYGPDVPEDVVEALTHPTIAAAIEIFEVSKAAVRRNNGTKYIQWHTGEVTGPHGVRNATRKQA